jgi:hypothetical protein
MQKNPRKIQVSVVFQLLWKGDALKDCSFNFRRIHNFYANTFDSLH